MVKRRVASLCMAMLGAIRAQTPETTAPTSLAELVRLAMERNRELLGIREQVSEARALLRQAGVRPAPTVEVSAGTGKAFGETGKEEYEAGYAYPVETFGKRGKRVRVAELSVALAETEVAQRSTQLAYEVETGYLEIVYQRQKLAVFDRLLSGMRVSSRLTAARVNEGDAAPLEAQLLLVAQSRTEAFRASTSGRVEAAELEVRRRVGLIATEAIPQLEPTSGVRVELSLEQMQQRALEKRADLRAARLLEEQRGAEVVLVEAQAHPDVTFSARYARRNTRFEGLYGRDAAGTTTLLRDQDDIVSVGASLPLLTKRHNQGAIAAAESRLVSIRLRREHIERTIPLEVEGAYRRWDAAKRTVELLRDGVIGQSEKNLGIIRQAYQLGQLRLLDVLNEQRRLTDTELAYLDARLEAARELAELERATGGLLQ